VRAKARNDRILVWNEMPDDARNFRRAVMIGGVRLEHHVAAVMPSHESIWAAADGHRREWRAIEVGGAAQDVSRNDRPLNKRAERARHGRSVALLEMDDHDVRVGRLDAREVVVRQSAHDVVRVVHDRVVRELYVVRCDRVSVAPACVVHQMVRDRQPVAADVAVALRWDTRCQIGDELAVLVVAEEPVEEQVCGIRLDGERPDHGVERRRLLLQPDAQRVIGSRRTVPHCFQEKQKQEGR